MSTLLSKLSSTIFLLRRLSSVLILKTRFTAYHALFHSCLSYCLIIWGSTSQSNLTEVFKLQKCALRTVLFLKRHAHCKQHFQKHKILTLYAQYVFQLLLYVHKHKSSIDTVGGKHSYPTRHGYLLASVNASKTQKILSNDVLSVGISYYNLLPKHIFELDFKNYKTQIKDLLTALAPYSIDEIKTHFSSLKIP